MKTSIDREEFEDCDSVCKRFKALPPIHYNENDVVKSGSDATSVDNTTFPLFELPAIFLEQLVRLLYFDDFQRLILSDERVFNCMCQKLSTWTWRTVAADILSVNPFEVGTSFAIETVRRSLRSVRHTSEKPFPIETLRRSQRILLQTSKKPDSTNAMKPAFRKIQNISTKSDHGRQILTVLFIQDTHVVVSAPDGCDTVKLGNLRFDVVSKDGKRLINYCAVWPDEYQFNYSAPLKHISKAFYRSRLVIEINLLICIFYVQLSHEDATLVLELVHLTKWPAGDDYLNGWFVWKETGPYQFSVCVGSNFTGIVHLFYYVLSKSFDRTPEVYRYQIKESHILTCSAACRMLFTSSRFHRTVHEIDVLDMEQIYCCPLNSVNPITSIIDFVALDRNNIVGTFVGGQYDIITLVPNHNINLYSITKTVHLNYSKIPRCLDARLDVLKVTAGGAIMIGTTFCTCCFFILSMDFMKLKPVEIDNVSTIVLEENSEYLKRIRLPMRPTSTWNCSVVHAGTDVVNVFGPIVYFQNSRMVYRNIDDLDSLIPFNGESFIALTQKKFVKMAVLRQ